MPRSVPPSEPSPERPTGPPDPLSEPLLALPAALVERARALAATGERRLLGVTGPPAAGKSTVAAALARVLGDAAVVVGMDGFHIADAELVRTGRRDRKGAPDTFDAWGYAHLLRRLRAADEPVVYAPLFDRDIEDSIGTAVPVARDVPLVITEGNYLLLDDEPWSRVRPLLHEVWYLDPDPGERVRRLVARHVRHGRAPDEARERAYGSDQRNADVIAATRARADLVVHL